MNSTIRRSILKTIGIGSAWSTPIVSSVMLPAHAATTDDVIVDDITVDEEYASAGSYQLIVPEGITQLKITVNGAGGGTANVQQKGTSTGGDGGQQTQTVTTIPGDTLIISVGGGGQDGTAGSKINKGKRKAIPGAGGTPGNGLGATSWGGGGGGMSVVTGPTITVRAPGGGGGSGADDNNIIERKNSRGGSGGGVYGGSPGIHAKISGRDGGDGGNGLGGLGSATTDTVTNPSQGEDGSVIITSV